MCLNKLLLSRHYVWVVIILFIVSANVFSGVIYSWNNESYWIMLEDTNKETNYAFRYVPGDVLILPNKDIIVAEYQYGDNSGKYGLLVMRLSPNGVIKWMKIYNSTNYWYHFDSMNPYSITMYYNSSDDSVLVGIGARDEKFFVLARINASNGEPYYIKAIEYDEMYCNPNFFVIDSEGKLVAVCQYSGLTGLTPFFLMRIDPLNGNLLWVKLYSNTSFDTWWIYVEPVIVDDNLVLVSYYYDDTIEKLWIISVDYHNGGIRWVKEYNVSKSLEVDRYVVVGGHGGYFYVIGGGRPNNWICKFNASGRLIWCKAYSLPGFGAAYVYDTYVGSNYMFIAYSTGGWYSKYFGVAKISLDGEPIWAKIYNLTDYLTGNDEFIYWLSLDASDSMIAVLGGSYWPYKSFIAKLKLDPYSPLNISISAELEENYIEVLKPTSNRHNWSIEDYTSRFNSINLSGSSINDEPQYFYRIICRAYSLGGNLIIVNRLSPLAILLGVLSLIVLTIMLCRQLIIRVWSRRYSKGHSDHGTNA